MTLDNAKEIRLLIGKLSDRIGTCENQVDKVLMAQAVGHLLIYLSKEDFSAVLSNS